jgi:hypothetical protein
MVKKKRVYKESSIQRELVVIFDEFNDVLKNNGILDVKYNFCQNGMPLPLNAKQNIMVRSRIKKYGGKKGHPDLMMYAPYVTKKIKYNSLAIELKQEKGKATKEQVEFLLNLRLQGWYATITFTLLDAIKHSFGYLLGVERCRNYVPDFYRKTLTRLKNENKI